MNNIDGILADINDKVADAEKRNCTITYYGTENLRALIDFVERAAPVIRYDHDENDEAPDPSPGHDCAGCDWLADFERANDNS